MLVSLNKVSSTPNFKSKSNVVISCLETCTRPEGQLILRAAYQEAKKDVTRAGIISKARKYKIPVANLSIPLTDAEKTILQSVQNSQAGKKPARYCIDQLF